MYSSISYYFNKLLYNLNNESIFFIQSHAKTNSYHSCLFQCLRCWEKYQTNQKKIYLGCLNQSKNVYFCLRCINDLR